MNIAIITTSRADFSIYLPLLHEFEKSTKFNIFIFASGTHVEKKFGNTYRLIENEGFTVHEKIKILQKGNAPNDMAHSMSKTMKQFSSIWNKYKNRLDLIIALGDRFEMFSAVAASIPFNIPIAHLHGGEQTLGCIDDKFRHAITAVSDFHFTSHPVYRKRVINIIGQKKNVFNVGALSIDAIKNTPCLSKKEFKKIFNFDLDKPYFLMTYHPETVNFGKNKKFIQELLSTFNDFNFPILCTLPNADSDGMIIRNEILKFSKKNPKKMRCVESLGPSGYFTAMKYCLIVIGNSSSGIIEAGALSRPVVNIGDRQKGRISGNNVIHVPNSRKKIKSGIQQALALNNQIFRHPYGYGRTAEKIVSIINKVFIHE